MQGTHDENCMVAVPAGEARTTVYVLGTFNSQAATQASRFSISLRAVDPATADTTTRDCSTRPPWNRTLETAVTLQLDVPLASQKLCRGMPDHYFWKVPGPLNAGDLLQLQATLDASTGDADFEVGTALNGVFTAGSVVTPMGCATGGDENCTTGLSAAQATWPEAYVRGYLFNALDPLDGSATLQVTLVP
jgi:hypothetical protein